MSEGILSRGKMNFPTLSRHLHIACPCKKRRTFRRFQWGKEEGGGFHSWCQSSNSAADLGSQEGGGGEVASERRPSGPSVPRPHTSPFPLLPPPHSGDKRDVNRASFKEEGFYLQLRFRPFYEETTDLSWDRTCNYNRKGKKKHCNWMVIDMSCC